MMSSLQSAMFTIAQQLVLEKTSTNSRRANDHANMYLH